MAKEKPRGITAQENEFRNNILTALQPAFEAIAGNSDDVLVVGSNKRAIPGVSAEGTEMYAEITVSIKRKMRDGTPYDGYELAQQYKQDCEDKRLEAEARAADRAARAEAKRKKTVADVCATAAAGESVIVKIKG